MAPLEFPLFLVNVLYSAAAERGSACFWLRVHGTPPAPRPPPREANNQPGGPCWGSLAPPRFFLNFSPARNSYGSELNPELRSASVWRQVYSPDCTSMASSRGPLLQVPSVSSLSTRVFKHARFSIGIQHLALYLLPLGGQRRGCLSPWWSGDLEGRSYWRQIPGPGAHSASYSAHPR